VRGRTDIRPLLALSVAFSTENGRPMPWIVLRRAIDDAIKARRVELAQGSGVRPCDMADTSAVTLKQPAAQGGLGDLRRSHSYRSRKASTHLRPPWHPLPCTTSLTCCRTSLKLPLMCRSSSSCPSLGDGQEVRTETIEFVNKLLDEGEQPGSNTLSRNCSGLRSRADSRHAHTYLGSLASQLTVLGQPH